jgi:two-component system response regulator ResD
LKFRLGNISVDTASREVRKSGKEIRMFRLEFDLLVYLCANKGLALSRAQIIKDVWGYDYTGTERSLDQAVCHLRKTLGPAGKAIKTMFTVGYKLKTMNTL